MKSYFLRLFLILFFSFFPIFSFAQNNSFTVSPSKIELEVESGQTKNISVNVKNNLDRDYYFKVDIQDLYYKEGEGILFGLNPGQNFSLKDYITQESETVFIRKGETTAVSFLVSLPDFVSPGSLHSALLFSPILNENPEVTNFSPEIGTLLLISVPGDIVYQASLLNFDFFDDFFSIAFENQSQTYLNPYGSIELKNVFGKTIHYEVDPWFVLPDSIRSRDIYIDKLSSGFYLAELKLNRGYSNTIDTANISFWVIRWPFVVSLLSILIFIFLIFFYLKKKKKNT